MLFRSTGPPATKFWKHQISTTGTPMALPKKTCPKFAYNCTLQNYKMSLSRLSGQLISWCSHAEVQGPMQISTKAILAAVALLLTVSSPALAGQLDRIRTDNVVRVCHWPAYYAISFYNSKSDKLEGIDIGLAQELAKIGRASCRDRG